jgi:hypothetical protein
MAEISAKGERANAASLSHRMHRTNRKENCYYGKKGYKTK